LVGLSVLAVAFFVVPTRVHERYLFPFFALAAIAAAVSWRWRIAYLVLGITTFLNMYVVLTAIYPDNPQISDWLGLGSTIRSSTWVTTIAAVNLLAFIWAMLQLRPGARATLEDEFEADSETERPGALQPVVLGTASAAATGYGGVAVSGYAPVPPTRALMAAPTGYEPSGSPGGADRSPYPPRPSSWTYAAGGAAAAGESPLFEFIHWVGAGIGGRLGGGLSLRGDRSMSLRGELGGRLDRIDVWLLVVLVVASLGLRMWRLDEPASMHFDEVYHARTATEFLQDWRYGIPHSIYEYTHPHLAKYAMAAGIVAFGDDKVTSTSSLGVVVKDAAIEPRWDDPTMPDHRAGDRLYVATGSEVRAYDLQSRVLLATIAAPGADAVAVDTADHRLYIATAAGAVSTMDTTAFDDLRTGAAPDSIAPPVAVGDFGMPIGRIFATDDGNFVIALTASGDIASMDSGNGRVLGTAGLRGAADVETAGTADGLVADPSQIADPSAAATTLAAILDRSVQSIADRLTGATDRVVISGALDPAVQAKVEAAIADGRLTGFTFTPLSLIAVADSKGVSMVAPADATVTDEVSIAGGATGLVASTGLDSPKLYVADGRSVTLIDLPDSSDPTAPPKIEMTIPMPGAVSKVTFDTASIMVHVLGRTPDGSAATIYVIEPHGNAVFADAQLPFTPVTWATDVAPLFPSSDRQAILSFDASGSVASVDIGSHEFSWRVPGVFLGALTGGLIFLLARLLFRRRSIAVLAAVFVLVDGMLFVQSRIGMNDVYVGFFLMAAYVLFAGLWLGRWRWRGAFWVLMPIVGALLGLALASKWVAAYAIAAVGLLILIRSALGRVLTILGMIAVTIYLGFQGLAVPIPDTGQVLTSGPNYFFMFLMIGLTLLAVAVSVLHPIAWSSEEMWFAVAAPAVAGTVLGLGAIAVAGRTASSVKLGPLSGTQTSLALEGAIGLFLVAAAIAGAFGLAGRFGFGPMAGTPAPTDAAAILDPPAPPAPGWLRPGTTFGLPVVWMVLSLLVVPIVVYIVSYVPWALNSGGPAGSPVIFPAGTPIVGQWPPGHDGQTLWSLTQAMYDYHNNLRQAHAAASPWWAWPLDLKPVWFYQGSFAGNTDAAIYNAGNLVVWWLSIPAIGFLCWQAFKRRSLALALIAVAFAFQWLSWSRIDRATFQYHYYTSVPFLILALAYLLAELWHGPSNRTWWLARISAAVAVMGPGLMWVFKEPLCDFVNVNQAYPNSPACVGSPANIVITAWTAFLVVVVVIAVFAIVYEVGWMRVGPS
ncbi:MAG TPA: phospholipid carrier-dependent glycosyltransferase, partial [Candidatus Binatia bacterium]|nr:phospholipid carrier-dependent glycosyltransferase [Candidatus Binatia bacterium]